MSENIRKAYSETYAILQLLQEEFLRKIPTNLIEFFKREKDNNYKVILDSSIALEKQNLLPETISILAMLKLDYWCKDEEEKQDLLETFNKNEAEYQNNLRMKYNPENLFKKRTTLNIGQDIKSQQLIQYKESLLKKMRKKILNFFNK